MRNPIKEWIVGIVREAIWRTVDRQLERQVKEFLEEKEESIDATLVSLRDSIAVARIELKESELNLTNSLGRILAENDRRNGRDAECLARAMAEEADYKKEQIPKTKGPYTTASGIVVPGAGSIDLASAVAAAKRKVRRAKS